MVFKFSRLASVIVPSMLVFGVYADTLQTTPGGIPSSSKYDTTTTSSAQLSGAQLGLTGPLEVGMAYSDLYGAIASAQYTMPITENQAFSLLLEGGPQQYRVNATYGIQFADKHRLKATVERLAQDMEFTFATGNQNQWVGQNALGLAYQYVIQSNWLNAFNVSGYYANSESSDLGGVNFRSDSADCSTINNGGSTACVNNRRIAGANTFGFEAGFEASPWKWSNFGLALNYDDIDYDTQYSNEYDENGFGFTATGEQLITPTLKATGIVSMRQTWNEFGAGLAWLIPTKVGHRLELGANVGYTGGKTTGNNNLTGELGLTYRWDGPRAKAPVYSLVESGKQEFIDWVSTPAVYMEEVLAIADEESVGITAKTTGTKLADVPLKENETIANGGVNWGSASFVSPSGDTLTYSSNNLPSGFSLDPQTGLLTGTAHACPPMAPLGQPCATYTVNVTAKTPYEIQQGMPGFTQPGVITIEPVSSGSIDLSGSSDTVDSMTETTTTTYDASSLFTWSVTPGLQAKKGAKGKKPDMPITYTYNSSASNTNGLDKVAVDPQTGLVTIIAATVANATSGSIVVTGDLHGPNGKSLSTADATIHYTVQPTALTATDAASNATVGEPVNINLDSYFENSCPITGTSYSMVDADASSLTVSGNTLSGTLTEPGQYNVKVQGASQCDKTAVSTLTITAEKVVAPTQIDIQSETGTLPEVIEGANNQLNGASLFTVSVINPEERVKAKRRAVDAGVRGKAGKAVSSEDITKEYAYAGPTPFPAGISNIVVNPTTGVVQVTTETIASNSVEAGQFKIKLTATASDGVTASSDAPINYSIQPSTVTGQDASLGTVVAGQDFSENIASYFTTNSPDGVIKDHRIVGSELTSLSLSGSGNTVLSGTIPTSTVPGTYTVNVDGVNSHDRTGTANFTINVEAAPAVIDIQATPGTLAPVFEGGSSELDASSLFDTTVNGQPALKAKAKVQGVASEAVSKSYAYVGSSYPAGISNIVVNPTTGLVTVQTQKVDTTETGSFKVSLNVTVGDVTQSSETTISYTVSPTQVTASNGDLGSVAPGTQITPVSLDDHFSTNGSAVMEQYALKEAGVEGFSIDSQNQLVGTPAAGTAPGQYTLQVEGTNNYGKTAVADFTVTVEALPTVIEIQAQPGSLPAVIEGENNMIDASKLFSWTINGEAAAGKVKARQAKQSSDSTVTAVYSLVDTAMPAGIESINVAPSTGLVTVKTKQVSAVQTGKFTVKLTLTSTDNVTQSEDTTIDYTVNPSTVTPIGYTSDHTVPPNMPVTIGDVDKYFTTNAQGGMKSFEVDSSTGFEIINGNMLRGTIPSNVERGSTYVVPVTGYNQYGKSAVANFNFPIVEPLAVSEINGGIPNVAGTAGVSSDEFVTASNYFNATPPGTKITYSISGLPSYGDYTFDPNTGKLSGMPKCSSLSNCNYRMTSSNSQDWAYKYDLEITARAEYAGEVQTATSKFKLCVAVDTGQKYQQAAQDCMNS